MDSKDRKGPGKVSLIHWSSSSKLWCFIQVTLSWCQNAVLLVKPVNPGAVASESDVCRVDQKKPFYKCEAEPSGRQREGPLVLPLPSQRWRVLLPAGYQGYKRHCRRGGAEDNGDALSLEDDSEKVKDIAVENGGFEYDDGSTAEEKKKEEFNSTLWDHPDPQQGFMEVPLWSKESWKPAARTILFSIAFRILLARFACLQCPQITTDQQRLSLCGHLGVLWWDTCVENAFY